MKRIRAVSALALAAGLFLRPPWASAQSRVSVETPGPAFAPVAGIGANIGTAASVPTAIPALGTSLLSAPAFSAAPSAAALAVAAPLAASLPTLALAPALTPAALKPAAPLAANAPAVSAATPASAPALSSARSAAADGPKTAANGNERPVEEAKEDSAKLFDGQAERKDDDLVANVTAGTGQAALPAAEQADAAKPAAEVPQPFFKRIGYKALVRTHGLGTFNDTALKTLFMVWVTKVLNTDLANLYIGTGTAAFMIPYVVLSSYAGPLADRVENAKLIRWLKRAEVGIATAALTLFGLASHFGPTHLVLAGLIALLGVMGTHSAFLAPAKERMLSKIVSDGELGAATARYNKMTFTGIVLGMLGATALGTLGGSAAFAAGGLVFVSLLGVWAAASLQTAAATRPAPASIPRELFSYIKDLKGTLAADWKAVRAKRSIWLTIVALSWFWFLGSIGQIAMPGYAKDVLGVGGLWLSGLLATLTAGIGVGATVAERLSTKKIPLGLINWGALGMSGFMFALSFMGAGPFGLACAFAAAFGLGVSSGLFNVPLNANFLEITPPETRGRYLGASNFIVFSSLALSAVFFSIFPALNMAFAAMHLAWHLGPAAVFGVMGALSLGMSFWLRRALPKMKPD